MIIPKVTDSSSCCDFLTDLVETNKAIKSFSARGLSLRLKWPRSFIPDVIAGRKKMTIERVVELGSYLNLDEFDLEYLVLLSIEQNSSPAARKFISGLKKTKFDSTYNDESDTNHEVAHNMEMLAMLEFIELTGRLPSTKEFGSIVNENPYSVEKIKNLVESLRQMGAIEILSKQIKLNWQQLFLDEKNLGTIHNQYIKNYMAFLEKGLPKLRSVNSGFVKLTEEEFLNFRRKLIALRNSLKHHEARAIKDSTGNKARLWQFELSLFTISPTRKELSK